MRRIKKALCAALAALALAGLPGCTGGEKDDGPDLDPAEMLQAMMAVDTTLPDMVTKSSQDSEAKDNFFYLSNLDYSKVDAYCYAFADAGTAEEMAVVKLKDKSDAAVLMESLHDHVNTRRGTFEEYSPDQVPLTDSAVITREGRYVVLIVSKKNGLAQKEFQKFFPEAE